MRKHLNLDSTVFISIRYFSFLVATIVSVLLNIFFFQSLDTGNFWWMLLFISILLELSKVSTLLTRNVFSSIYLKTLKPKINFIKKTFFIFYLLLATLSVITGLGFSIVVTSKSATIQEMGVTVLETKIEELRSLELRRINYVTAKDGTLSEYPPYIDANNKFIEAQSAQELAELNYRTAIAERNRYPNDPESSTWALRQAAQREVTAQEQLRIAANDALRNARDRRTLIVNEYEEVQTNADLRIADLDKEFTIMSRDLELTSSTPRLAVIELEQQLSELNRKIIEAKGMGYMFDIFAQFLKVSPEAIKFWILLFVAFLIELTIYQCSPDIRVNRRILYFFRNYIPLDIEINGLLNKFDMELKRFEDKDTDNDESFTIGEPDPIQIPVVGQMKATFNKPTPLEFDPVVQPAAEPDYEEIRRRPPIKRKEIKKVEKTPEEAFIEKIVNSDPVPTQSTIELPETTIFQQHVVEKQEEKNIEYLPEKPEEIAKEKKESKKIDSNSIHYRFGRTTETIIENLIKFINLCIDNPGKFKMHPDDAATEMKLSKRAQQVFINQLSSLRLGSKYLITKKNDDYIANYSAQEIIDYATEIIS